jgi:hypothetical protein
MVIQPTRARIIFLKDLTLEVHRFLDERNMTSGNLQICSQTFTPLTATSWRKHDLMSR